jgi:hypothetical protein
MGLYFTAEMYKHGASLNFRKKIVCISQCTYLMWRDGSVKEGMGEIRKMHILNGGSSVQISRRRSS